MRTLCILREQGSPEVHSVCVLPNTAYLSVTLALGGQDTGAGTSPQEVSIAEENKYNKTKQKPGRQNGQARCELM